MVSPSHQLTLPPSSMAVFVSSLKDAVNSLVMRPSVGSCYIFISSVHPMDAADTMMAAIVPVMIPSLFIALPFKFLFHIVFVAAWDGSAEA